MDYLFLGEEPRVFTNHRNLLFCYSPSVLDPTLGRHKVMKVLRWAILLSQFQYRIDHVDGEDKVMADIMTRWVWGYCRKRAAIRRVTYKLMEHTVVPSPNDDTIDWPSEEQIRQAQDKLATERPKQTKREGNSLWHVGDRTWVPEKSDGSRMTYNYGC